jgi:LCP family protein required for cell wall assembly
MILILLGIFLAIYFNNSSTTAHNKFSDIIKLKDFEFEKLDEPFNTLLLGGDVTNSLTDTIMIVNVNPKEEKLSMFSIPRDLKVLFNDRYHKINHIVNLSDDRKDGIENLINILEEEFHININNYIFFNTTVISDSVNVLGGMDYYIPIDIDYDDSSQNLHIHFKKGYQHLNGEEVVEYLRFRKQGSYTKMRESKEYYDGSDLKRIDAQQGLIREIISQKLKPKYILKYKSILDIVYNRVDTNYNLNDILKITYNVNSIKQNQLNTFRIQGYDEMVNGQYYLGNNEMVINTKTEEVLRLDKIVNKYFYNKYQPYYN